MQEIEERALVRLRKPSVVLFGFHGTIAPVDWEDRCIEGYVRENLLEFLLANWNQNEVYQLICGLKDQSFDEHFVYETANAPLIIGFNKTFSNKDSVVESVYRFVAWQMSRSRLSKESLCLVRKCWTEGFEKKAIQTIIFDDVVPCIKRFTALGIVCGIYTNMSKDLCQLVLTSTTSGDISKLFRFYLDADSVGKRCETNFYKNVAQMVNVSASEILFLTDYGQDVKLCTENGLQGAIILRPGNRKTRTYYLIRFPSTDSLDKIELVQTTETDNNGQKSNQQSCKETNKESGNEEPGKDCNKESCSEPKKESFGFKLLR